MDGVSTVNSDTALLTFVLSILIISSGCFVFTTDMMMIGAIQNNVIKSMDYNNCWDNLQLMFLLKLYHSSLPPVVYQ